MFLTRNTANRRQNVFSTLMIRICFLMIATCFQLAQKSTHNGFQNKCSKTNRSLRLSKNHVSRRSFWSRKMPKRHSGQLLALSQKNQQKPKSLPKLLHRRIQHRHGSAGRLLPLIFLQESLHCGHCLKHCN